MIVVKRPEFENDDYLIRLDLEKIPKANEVFDLLKTIDPQLADYYWAKHQAFAKQDTTPSLFDRFVENKPSLRSLSELDQLDSTIYTVACERENEAKYYDLIFSIKEHLTKKPATRRCVLRLSNAYPKYFFSEIIEPVDVTCLSFIHYLSAGPKLVFRASDIKNELLVDILTIRDFFVDPVYGFNVKNLQMSIYSSTAQGVSAWDQFVHSLNVVCNIEEKI